jgi:protein CpxP
MVETVGYKVQTALNRGRLQNHPTAKPKAISAQAKRTSLKETQMKTPSSTLKQNAKRLMIGAGLALILPLAAQAQSAPPAGPGADGPRPEHRWHGEGRGDEHGGAEHRGMHHHGMHRHHGMMGLLRGVKLTDAQRDKMFALHHAMEPQAYEKIKVLRKSHEDLRGAATSPNYDEAKVKAAIDASARAKADLQLMRVHAEHEVFAMLTPEQKAQVEQNKQNFMQHRMSMEGRDGRRGERQPQK